MPESTVLAWVKKNWFLLGLVAVLVLGILIPGSGSSLNPRSITSTAIIVVLFLISGATLPSETILKGLSDFKLHLFIQVFIFFVIPAFFFLATNLLGSILDPKVRIGIIALACLPTTISSCIVFTHISGGNVVGTMFNAALGNTLGIFLSPLLLSFLLRTTGQALPPEEMVRIFTSLCLKMLLPIVVGQILRQFVRDWVTEHRKKLSVTSNLMILLIVFLSIAKAAANPRFVENLKAMLWPMVLLAVSHVILVFLAYGGARLIRFSRENTISVLFTAPQKTLAMGVPLLSTYFAGNDELLAMAILPLIFYHAWQLVVAGFIRSSSLVGET